MKMKRRGRDQEQSFLSTQKKPLYVLDFFLQEKKNEIKPIAREEMFKSRFSTHSCTYHDNRIRLRSVKSSSRNKSEKWKAVKLLSSFYSSAMWCKARENHPDMLQCYTKLHSIFSLTWRRFCKMAKELTVGKHFFQIS